jgi:hypothetical protein
MTALFARTMPARTFKVLAAGIDSPPGKTVRNPAAVGSTAVTFRATAFAVTGTPQTPHTGKLRGVPAASTGPPKGPVAARVSAMRHGASVWKLVPGTTGGVAVGVGLGPAVGETVGVAVKRGVDVGVVVRSGGVSVGVGVGVRVAVGVDVGVAVRVEVGVAVEVRVGVGVGVTVGVGVGVKVGVPVGVRVGVRVIVTVGVGVKTNGPPVDPLTSYVAPPFGRASTTTKKRNVPAWVTFIRKSTSIDWPGWSCAAFETGAERMVLKPPPSA